MRLLEKYVSELPCWEAIRDRYNRWNGFMEDQVFFSLSDSNHHTKDHCSRVLLYTLMIGDALGAAAVFHDSRRQDDWLDVGHGQRAADYYRNFCCERQQPMDERTYWIMAFHDRDDEIGVEKIRDSGVDNGILLYRIFKDSDGLDRFRLGPNALDVSMLRTEKARMFVEFARRISTVDKQ